MSNNTASNNTASNNPVSKTLTLSSATINDRVAKTIAKSRAVAVEEAVRVLRHSDIDASTWAILASDIEYRVERSTVPESTRRGRAMECVIEEFKHRVGNGDKMIALFDFIMDLDDQELFRQLFEDMLSHEEKNNYELATNDVGTTVVMTRRY